MSIAAIAFESQHFLPNMHLARKHYLRFKLQNKQLLKVVVSIKVIARYNAGFTYLFKHLPSSFLFAIIYLFNDFSMFWLPVAYFSICFNLLYFHLSDSFIYYSLLVWSYNASIHLLTYPLFERLNLFLCFLLIFISMVFIYLLHVFAFS